MFSVICVGGNQIHLGTRSLWDSTDIKERRIRNSSRSELVTAIRFAAPSLSLRSLWCRSKVTEFRETNAQYSRHADPYPKGLKKEKSAMTQSIAQFQWLMHDAHGRDGRDFLVRWVWSQGPGCPTLWSSAIKDRTSGRVSRSVTHRRLKGLIVPPTLQQLCPCLRRGSYFCWLLSDGHGWRWRVPSTERVPCIKPEGHSIVRQKINTPQISRTPQRLVTLRLLRGGGGTELVLPF